MRLRGFSARAFATRTLAPIWWGGGAGAAMVPSLWRLFVVAKEPRGFVVPTERRPRNV